MRRGLAVLACLCAISGCAYYAVGKWGIRHETLNLYDNARLRPVAVDLAVRWDYEMKTDGFHTSRTVGQEPCLKNSTRCSPG